MDIPLFLAYFSIFYAITSKLVPTPPENMIQKENQN